MDTHGLRSNDQYKKRIFEAIDSSDILYLFWSQHAKHSNWVDQEWRYGFRQKGLGFIDPVCGTLAGRGQLFGKGVQSWQRSPRDKSRIFHRKKPDIQPEPRPEEIPQNKDVPEKESPPMQL
jgi:hypothetical protein